MDSPDKQVFKNVQNNADRTTKAFVAHHWKTVNPEKAKAKFPGGVFEVPNAAEVTFVEDPPKKDKMGNQIKFAPLDQDTKGWGPEPVKYTDPLEFNYLKPFVAKQIEIGLEHEGVKSPKAFAHQVVSASTPYQARDVMVTLDATDDRRTIAMQFFLGRFAYNNHQGIPFSIHDQAKLWMGPIFGISDAWGRCGSELQGMRCMQGMGHTGNHASLTPDQGGDFTPQWFVWLPGGEDKHHHKCDHFITREREDGVVHREFCGLDKDHTGAHITPLRAGSDHTFVPFTTMQSNKAAQHFVDWKNNGAAQMAATHNADGSKVTGKPVGLTADGKVTFAKDDDVYNLLGYALPDPPQPQFTWLQDAVAEVETSPVQEDLLANYVKTNYVKTATPGTSLHGPYTPAKMVPPNGPQVECHVVLDPGNSLVPFVINGNAQITAKQAYEPMYPKWGMGMGMNTTDILAQQKTVYEVKMTNLPQSVIDLLWGHNSSIIGNMQQSQTLEEKVAATQKKESAANLEKFAEKYGAHLPLGVLIEMKKAASLLKKG